MTEKDVDEIEMFIAELCVLAKTIRYYQKEAISTYRYEDDLKRFSQQIIDKVNQDHEGF